MGGETGEEGPGFGSRISSTRREMASRRDFGREEASRDETGMDEIRVLRAAGRIDFDDDEGRPVTEERKDSAEEFRDERSRFSIDCGER